MELATLKKFFFRIFGLNELSTQYTAHLGLPFFLARCIPSTGLNLITVYTSPQILVLRFDSPDQQPQWRDIGGTVPKVKALRRS